MKRTLRLSSVIVSMFILFGCSSGPNSCWNRIKNITNQTNPETDAIILGKAIGDYGYLIYYSCSNIWGGTIEQFPGKMNWIKSDNDRNVSYYYAVVPPGIYRLWNRRKGYGSILDIKAGQIIDLGTIEYVVYGTKTVKLDRPVSYRTAGWEITKFSDTITIFDYIIRKDPSVLEFFESKLTNILPKFNNNVKHVEPFN